MDGAVRQALAGSREAREQLVEQLAPELRAYVQAQVGPALRRRVSVSDICQDAVIRALRDLSEELDGLDADGLRSRLLRNARWAIADAARALHKLHGESSAGAMTPDVVRHDDGHSHGPVTRADDARWLQKLIDTLEGGHAQVLRLRMQGRSFDEIGVALDERPATVRQRYHRAYHRLADLVRWAEQQGDGGDDV
jgi:RNA polymerase sigma factor (sigma-70 family)